MVRSVVTSIVKVKQRAVEVWRKGAGTDLSGKPGRLSSNYLVSSSSSSFRVFRSKKTIIFGASYISVVIFLGEILALVMGMKAQRRGCVKLVRFPQPTSSWDKLAV